MTQDATGSAVFPLVRWTPKFGQVAVGNQQKWYSLRAERSGAVLRCGELPEGHVVLSSPFDCLGFYLPSAL